MEKELTPTPIMSAAISIDDTHGARAGNRADAIPMVKGAKDEQAKPANAKRPTPSAGVPAYGRSAHATIISTGNTSQMRSAGRRRTSAEESSRPISMAAQNAESADVATRSGSCFASC